MSSAKDLIHTARDGVCRVVCPDLRSAGTGFFVTADVLITCDHVVSEDALGVGGTLTHTFSASPLVVMGDGRVLRATLVSSTTSTRPYAQDYAILKVAAANAKPLRVGKYVDVQVGEDLIVLGYPLGIDYVVATRAMAAAKASVDSTTNALFQTEIIELDGAVNVGNSGGPAISLERDEVVGVVSTRHGSIQDRIDDLRDVVRGSASELVTMPILEILEGSDDFLNPGIGRANSTSYVLQELSDLGTSL